MGHYSNHFRRQLPVDPDQNNDLTLAIRRRERLLVMTSPSITGTTSTTIGTMTLVKTARSHPLPALQQQLVPYQLRIRPTTSLI